MQLVEEFQQVRTLQKLQLAYKSMIEAGLLPISNSHWTIGRVHPGHVASPSHTHTPTRTHTDVHTHTKGQFVETSQSNSLLHVEGIHRLGFKHSSSNATNFTIVQHTTKNNGSYQVQS